jgi:hypothetical protein
LADLTLAVAQSHAEAPHQTGHSHLTDDDLKLLTPAQVIARQFVPILKYAPDQLRDAHGQFATEGVPRSLLQTVINPDGGFTYSPTSKSSPKTGFMVSIYKSHEKVLDASEVDGVVLAEYVRKNRRLLQKPGNYLGAWHNPENGKVYLDVSRHTESREEAAHLGQKHEQEAYFDLVRGRSVKVRHGKKTVVKVDRQSGTG